jgi:Ca-activated chloride channel family protein
MAPSASLSHRAGGLLVLCLALIAAAFSVSCGGGSDSSSGSSAGGSASSGGATNPATTLEVVFTYGSEKEVWIKEATDAFNRSGKKTADGKQIKITAIPMGSGECIDELLNETRQAHLTSPASAAFIKLGNAQSRAKTGKDLLPSTENLVLSPVVIAMWKPMAEALGWGKKPVGWADILALAKDPNGWRSRGNAQWGDFKFGHTHPQFSNSGLAALIAEVYAGAKKTSGLTRDDLQPAHVATFVDDIERSVVHYGSSTGFFGREMFASGPQYLSAAVLYENMVIEASNQQNLAFPVVALYPKEGTFWSDHPVGIVDRPWVTPAHKDAAKAYIQFLLARPQQERAIAHGFRPALVEVPLAAPIDTAHGVDPKEPQTTLEVPTPEVINGILDLWRDHKKRSDVTLVFDTSGSMQEEGKIVSAREGAKQLISLLNDADEFSLLPFSTTVSEAGPIIRVKTGRADATTKIDGLFPEGKTALYDAIDAAYQRVASRAKPDKIQAIVVLTDGADTSSRMKLEDLLARIKATAETRPIKVFTIAYGREANRQILQAIAAATHARSYDGTPQNILGVFKDVSTFF